MIHLALLVRKLSCTEAGSLIHHDWRLHLKVACLGVNVKEIIDERSLKTCTLALIDRESRSGELHSEVKVYYVELLCKLPMRQSLLTKLRNLISGFHDHIVLRTLAQRHLVARDVRKKHHKGLQLGIVLLRSLLDFRRTRLQGSNVSLCRLSLIFASFLHERTYHGRFLPLLGKAGIEFSLERPSLHIKAVNFLYNLPCVEILDRKLRDHKFRILTKKFECQHILFVLLVQKTV